jgi:hypothetical protein
MDEKDLHETPQKAVRRKNEELGIRNEEWKQIPPSNS